jgi:hypothetical protein
MALLMLKRTVSTEAAFQPMPYKRRSRINVRVETEPAVSDGSEKKEATVKPTGRVDMSPVSNESEEKSAYVKPTGRVEMSPVSDETEEKPAFVKPAGRVEMSPVSDET